MFRTRGVIAVAAIVLALSISACSDPILEALNLEGEGDWEGALAVYQSVLEGDPSNTEALSGMAAGLWLLGRYDEALPYQERVVAGDPEDVLGRLELGFNYLNHQERPGDAVQVFEEAATLEPSAEVLFYLGQAEIEAGYTDDAERSLRRAIEAEPTYGNAYRLLIELLESQGRDDEAAAMMKSAQNNNVDLRGVE